MEFLSVDSVFLRRTCVVLLQFLHLPMFHFTSQKYLTQPLVNVIHLDLLLARESDPTVNVSGMHWTVAVVHMSEKRIQFYDSMSGSGDRYLEGLMQYLKDEHMAKKGCPLPDADEWELVESAPDTPQQRNGYDCGVFTCMFCDFLSTDCPLTFSQEHITQCRERIALSIMKGVAIE